MFFYNFFIIAIIFNILKLRIAPNFFFIFEIFFKGSFKQIQSYVIFTGLDFMYFRFFGL